MSRTYQRRLGQTVRRFRRARRMTQQTLAERTGVARGYVVRLEAGQHDPTVGTVRKLAKTLGVALGELLE